MIGGEENDALFDRTALRQRIAELEKKVSAYREVLNTIRDTAEKHTADLADSVLKFNEEGK